MTTRNYNTKIKIKQGQGVQVSSHYSDMISNYDDLNNMFHICTDHVNNTVMAAIEDNRYVFQICSVAMSVSVDDAVAIA